MAETTKRGLSFSFSATPGNGKDQRKHFHPELLVFQKWVNPVHCET